MMFLSLIFIILQIRRIDTERLQCPLLTLPKHGFIFSGHCEREPGSLCGLGCFSGYRLVQGDSLRECQKNGTWSGEQPTCEGKTFLLFVQSFLCSLTEIRCPLLRGSTYVVQECSPEQNTTNVKFGTKCRAKCNETGYRLLGPRVRECLIVGLWTGYEQFCIGKDLKHLM